MRRLLSFACVALVAACTKQPRELPRTEPAPSTQPVVDEPHAAAPPSALPSASASPPTPPKPPIVAANDAASALFLDPKEAAAAGASCPAGADDAVRVKCLLTERYKSDPVAQKLALELYDTSGHVAALYPEEIFDGGYRGKIKLVPELPIGKYRKHLEWTLSSARDFDAVYGAIAAAAGKAFSYRWKPILLRYYRSVDKHTPNGFTSGDWVYAYNVVGSLLSSEQAARELVAHEVFHINDAAHGMWSSKIDSVYQSIVKKCGTKMTCLAPYTPTEVTVKGGTYYAFQPGNSGVGEYAAELLVRYYREQRAVLRKEKLATGAFKCGPTENATTWKAFVDEFFGGVDWVPGCNGAPAPTPPPP